MYVDENRLSDLPERDEYEEKMLVELPSRERNSRLSCQLVYEPVHGRSDTHGCPALAKLRQRSQAEQPPDAECFRGLRCKHFIHGYEAMGDPLHM